MKNDKKNFLLFSGISFLFISVIAVTIFIVSSRQINRAYIVQQLSFASETIRLRLATAVNSELALVLKMADSAVIREYFMNPFDPGLESLARIEFDAYQRHFGMGIVFWVNDVDKIFHSTGNESYLIDPDDPESYWYNMTLYDTERYNFNINYNSNLQQIYLWVNAPVFLHLMDATENGKRPIGLLGTGIDLTRFSDFVANAYREFEVNIDAYTFNKFHEITTAANYEYANNKVNIADYYGDTGAKIIRMIAMLSGGESIHFTYDGKIFLVNSIPEMEWYLLVSHPLPGLFSLNQSMNILFFSMLFLILVILTVLNIFNARSENVMAEQNLRLIDANTKAEAANRSKSNFLATMSHEIRTPLNAIIGIAQIEMQDESLSDKHVVAYGKIQDSGATLLGIINDILDMSKIETGKMALNPIEYNVPILIHDTIQLNIVRIGSKPIEFKLSVDENLPSMLFGDEIRLKQILNNLLSNAIKYTDKGQINISVYCEIISEDIKLVFSVSDTGQGMKPEDREKLFSEYLRFNTASNRATEGSGLGLNITKKLVEMMDGTIGVESEYGKGSTFTVTVKQTTVECPPIGKEIAKSLNSFNYVNDNKKELRKMVREIMPYGSVLVVDDVDTNLYVAQGLLLPYRLEIEMANSGFAAIEKTESGKKYDVIFMDHMMPQMDGIETTQKLRESGYTGVIIALTANALVGNAEMFAQNGFDGFIPKPIDIRLLNTILNKFIRDRHPDEAKKYKPETITQGKTKEYAALAAPDTKVKQIFCQDAKKAMVTLRETAASDDMKLFTITAHAMKSALANIGEHEASMTAFALESAGQQSDEDYISLNTERFIKILEDLTANFSSIETDEAVDEDVSEDIPFLKEQLQIIKTACTHYDDDSAYSALDRLKEKSWRKETSSLLEQIRDKLFIYSDFDGAAKQADREL